MEHFWEDDRESDQSRGDTDPERDLVVLTGTSLIT